MFCTLKFEFGDTDFSPVSLAISTSLCKFVRAVSICVKFQASDYLFVNGGFKLKFVLVSINSFKH